MALKILLLLTISFSSFAYKFRDALYHYKKSNYQRSISILQRIHGKSLKRYPNRSLMLLAKNYEKSDEHMKGLKIYFYLLKKKYRRKDAMVRRHIKLKKDIDEIDELPKGMIKIYYALFHSYVAIYLEKGYEQYSEFARSYGELLIEQEYKEDEVEEILNNLKKEEQRKIDSKEQTNYYLGLGYSTWQDQLTLTASNGSESEIKSSAEGTTLFGIMTTGNLFYEYKFEVSITKANATVGEDSPDFVYFQTNVAEMMVSFSAGHLWKTSKNVGIGLSVPIIYRTGDFTTPAGFELDNGDMFSVGLLGNLSWNISHFLVDFKFGKILKFHSSFAQLGLAYKF